MQTFSMSEEVEVVVVGGGQSGVSMSEHLGNAGVPHVVLERGRIAEKWRSGRWDSLVANGPAWHDRFPGLEFDGDPAAFVPKEQVADYFAAYAQKIGAPIRCGVDVTSVQKNAGAPGFRVQTSHGTIHARFVVAATGPFQRPVIPPIIGGDTAVTQLHSARYRLPHQGPAAGGKCPRDRARRIGRAARRRARAGGPPRLPLGRPARPAAAA